MSDIRPYQVPQNFGGKFTIAGLSLSWAGAIEGTIFGGIVAGVMYFLLTYYSKLIGIVIPTRMLISVVIFSLVLGVFFGMKGINGDAIHVYIKHVITSNFERQKAKYNPRVKYELTYERSLKQRSIERQDAGQSGNSTSLFKLYQPKLKKKKAVTEKPKEERQVEYIFTDDVGIIEKTPDEMMKTLKRRNKLNKLRKNLLRNFKKGSVSENEEI